MLPASNLRESNLRESKLAAWDESPIYLTRFVLARPDPPKIAAIVSGITFGLIFDGSTRKHTPSHQRLSALVDELALAYVLA